MKMGKLASASLTGAIALVLATGGAAFAETSEVGGGTWEHGTTGAWGDGTVYSNYLHDSKSHGSSVENCDGVIDRSPTVAPGVWSNAQTYAVAFCADYAYWRVVE